MNNQQIAVETVSNLLDQAKQLLKQAEGIANENNLYFCMQDFYEDITGDYPDWNSSAC